MTSCSVSAEVVALALVCAVGSGCAADQIEETQSIVFAESNVCRLVAMQGGMLASYELELFEFPQGTAVSPEAPPCECIVDGTCPLVRRQCRCGPPHPPLTGTINAVMEGTRLIDVDPSLRYCARLRGYRIATGAMRPEDCDCPETRPPDEQLCFSSTTPFISEVGENAAAFVLPGDCVPAGCGVMLGPGP